MLPTDPDAPVIQSWGHGPFATVELRGGSDGGRAIHKTFRSRLAMWREYTVLRLLRRSDVVPQVLQFKPAKRVLVLEWVAGIRVTEWVLRKFEFGQDVIEKYRGRTRIKSDPDSMQAFERFRASQDAECLALVEAMREAYRPVHARHIVHNDLKPSNIIVRNTTNRSFRVCLLDFESATLRWDARRRDSVDFQFWFGRHL